MQVQQIAQREKEMGGLPEHWILVPRSAADDAWE